MLSTSPPPLGTAGLLRGPRTILVGRGQRHGLGRAAARLGSSAWVVTDRRMGDSPEFQRLLDVLDAEGVSVSVFADVQPELPESSIHESVLARRGESPDVVIGIGGGSCLDHAKLGALLLAHGGVLGDYYGENRVPGPVVPIIALPTTAGTGSEATPVAVVSDSGRPVKVGISSSFLIPETAIVDADLVMACPPALTAHSGADALAHCVESYTAVRRTLGSAESWDRVFVGAGAVTSSFALAGLELIGRSLVACVEDGGDRVAREAMSLAALYGGLALGTAGTAAAHAIQYPVGAMTSTPHGLGVGVLLPYVMEFNSGVRQAELTQIAVALGSLGPEALADADAGSARAGIDAVEAVLRGAGIPATLRDLGLHEHDVSEVVRLSLGATRLVENNPRPLDEEGCRRIVHAAFHGDRGLAR